MNFKGKMYEKSGITLIGLVVTIIVLLVLAGVTIATLTGDNGILTRAQDAKNKTEQAQKDEEDILNSYEDQINEYAGIDWDKVLANAKKHPEQTTSTAIGVGTDGRSVNMDLWIYSTCDNGYALNSFEVLSGSIQNAGYSNDNIETDSKKEGYGKIKGTIPTYISEDNGESWKPVVNLNRTFYHCTNLISMPEIPTTVVDLIGTFMGCTSLQQISNIPDSVTDMVSTFYNCTSLQQIPDIPDSVTDMERTFYNCISLQQIADIPDSVTDMASTFSNCTSLQQISNIPDSVTDMANTFYNCTSLQQIPDIPNKVTNMNSTFRNCNSLTKINITIPKTVTNIRNMFSGCTHLCGNINILANLSLAIEEDGYYSYNGWLGNTSTETTENLILGPIENKTLIEQIIPNNSNIKGVWE